MKEKSTILIVDDSELNRAILIDILGDDYQFIEAENGAQAIDLLRNRADIDLLLLDMVMPEMNGFDVLTAMNSNRQIEDIPVVMISSENGIEQVERAYDLGVTDYINRPFDGAVVRRRVVNTLMLFAKQKHLMQLVEEQIYEKEKSNNLMINIFSHIVEFRNGESGQHVLHIRTITEILLSCLVQKTDRYPLTQADIQLIGTASALHDIGKVSIPDEIINKPGRLTKEEFEVMKSHTTIGAAILRDLPFSADEPLLKTAYEIARWHHERYDGRGYPDGLSGEDIPIAAQVVSVADVYDALTSVRCYKPAYDHETALQMILNGECGTFNPLLLECLLDVAPELKKRLLSSDESTDYMARAHRVSTEALLKESIPQMDRSVQALENERAKTEFFAQQTSAIQFDYDTVTHTITVTDRTGLLPFTSKLFDMKAEEKFPLLSEMDNRRVSEALRSTTPAKPEARLRVMLRVPEHNIERICKMKARALWSHDDKPEYLGAVGMFSAPQEALVLPNTALPDSGSITGAEAYEAVTSLKRIFDLVRLVDPTTSTVLTLDETGRFTGESYPCFSLWERGEKCENCISYRCMQEKNRLTKLEITESCAYQIVSEYLNVDGRECVLELGSKISDGVWMTSAGKQFRLDGACGQDFYLDPVTGAYSRRYLEDQQPELEKGEALAVIDVDHFKQINDTHGHLAGDAVLRHVALVILDCVKPTDTLIRYGGDEFLLVLSQIPPEKFRVTLDKIRAAINETPVPHYPDIHPTVSIGGVYQAHPLAAAIHRADQLMYWAKRKRNDVQT